MLERIVWIIPTKLFKELFILNMVILAKSFYNRSTLRVAQDLLGCFLVRTSPPAPLPSTGSGQALSKKRGGREVIKCKIVEIEAYHGSKDLASHASRGKTERNKVMFGEPGVIYVYMIYGMYNMLNIVTGAKDYPAAVLVRAVEPGPHPNPPLGKGREIRTNGPGRLTKVLGIDKSFNGLPVYTKKYGLWIEGREEDVKPSQIVRSTRVGVDYAGAYKDKKWRFYIKNNKFVSKK